MTLITVAANFEFVVQVSDRRLTGPAGPLPEEQSNAIHFHIPAADFLVGYTGLAAVGSEPMHRLLMVVLSESAEKAAFELLPTVEAVTEGLTALFKSRRVMAYRPQDRRLSMMMTGFHRVDDDHHTVIQGLWTNFQLWGVGDAQEAWDEFIFTPRSVKAGETWPTLVQRIGAYNALSGATIESEIRPLLMEGKPPVAVRNKILDILPAQSATHPTVGVSANAAMLFPNGDVQWSYWTGEPAWHYVGGNTVVATPEQTLLTADFEMWKVDKEGNPSSTGAPMVVPRVARNRPCPCGSGKRYRQCHEKFLS